MQKRTQARRMALQVLYALDTQDGDVVEAAKLYLDIEPKDGGELEIPAPGGAREFALRLVQGTWEHRTAIDEAISRCSENWAVARMSRVDRCILRLAVYELLFCQDIPPKVSMNEAIDLGKLYGSENSGGFINGILDALYAHKAAVNRKADEKT